MGRPDNVSRETWEQLETFAGLIAEWNGAVRLVSDGDRERILARHVMDCLAIVPLIEGAEAMADLGSGAGLPGLVVAIASGKAITLIEANQRKAAFLREAVRRTAARAIVRHARIEDVTDTYDLVMARALAPLPTLLHLAAPRLRPGGRCVFPKGRLHQVELSRAAAAWTYDVQVYPTTIAAPACVLVLSNIVAKAAR